MENNTNLYNKVSYLENMAQSEQWDYKGSTEKQILYNYLCYTYDRIKEEDKIVFLSFSAERS